MINKFSEATGQEKLQTHLIDHNYAMTQMNGRKESDNPSYQSSSDLCVPGVESKNSSGKINRKCQETPLTSDTQNDENLISKELESIVKLQNRGRSKRRLRPSWKLSEYLDIGDSDTTADNPTTKNFVTVSKEENHLSDDYIDLDMEVIEVPPLNHESYSKSNCLKLNDQAQKADYAHISGVDSGTSVYAPVDQECVELGSVENNVNDVCEGLQASFNSRSSNSCNTNVKTGNQISEDRETISKKDKGIFEITLTERRCATHENMLDLNVNIDMDTLFNPPKHVNKNITNTVDYSTAEAAASLQSLINTLNGQFDFIVQAKIPELVKAKEWNTANQETTEEAPQLHVRAEGKRAVKPTWKLSEYRNTEDTKNKRKEHSPQKSSSGLGNQKKMSNKSTTITDKKKTDKLKIERKGQQLITRTRTLYCVKDGDFNNMYYLKKKPQKTTSLEKAETIVKSNGKNNETFPEPFRNDPNSEKRRISGKTSSKKAETIVKLNDKNNKTIAEQFKLEDHPNSYSIENYTDLARDLRQKPDEEKQCQRFLCEICKSYRTVLIENLQHHIQLHVTGKLDCKSCRFIADSPYHLHCHVNENHPKSQGSLVCELCGAVKGSSDSFKVHASKVHGIAAFKCSHCESTFHKQIELRRHMLSDHKSSVFQCDKCKAILMSQIGLESHFAKCVNKMFKCKHCSCVKNSKTLLGIHERCLHAKEHFHKCNICTFSARSQKQLTNHMNAHLGIHEYSCDICDFSCVKKAQLDSHKRRHTGEKKFKCDKCCYAAAWNVQLKTHMKAHESETQCLCKDCGIVLKDQRCLKLHQQKEHGSIS